MRLLYAICLLFHVVSAGGRADADLDDSLVVVADVEEEAPAPAPAPATDAAGFGFRCVRPRPRLASGRPPQLFAPRLRSRRSPGRRRLRSVARVSLALFFFFFFKNPALPPPAAAGARPLLGGARGTRGQS
jgi:hypothetical protein